MDNKRALQFCHLSLKLFQVNVFLAVKVFLFSSTRKKNNILRVIPLIIVPQWDCRYSCGVDFSVLRELE